MKVVLRSSSLLFTLLSIVFNVPISRVKRKPDGDGPVAVEDFREPSRDRGRMTPENAYRLHPRPPG
jgi:hypothetical protein